MAKPSIPAIVLKPHQEELFQKHAIGPATMEFVAACAHCTKIIPKGTQYYRSRHLGDYCSERHFRLRLQGVSSEAERLATAEHKVQQLEQENSPFRQRLTVALIASLGTALGSFFMANMTRPALLITAVGLLFVLLNQTISKWNSGQSGAEIRRALLNVESMRRLATAEKPSPLPSTSAATEESQGSHGV